MSTIFMHTPHLVNSTKTEPEHRQLVGSFGGSETPDPFAEAKARAESERSGLAQRTEPVAWTRIHNGGRVFYTSLGHQRDFEVEMFLRLLANAVLWAGG